MPKEKDMTELKKEPTAGPKIGPKQTQKMGQDR